MSFWWMETSDDLIDAGIMAHAQTALFWGTAGSGKEISIDWLTPLEPTEHLVYVACQKNRMIAWRCRNRKPQLETLRRLSKFLYVEYGLERRILILF